MVHEGRALASVVAAQAATMLNMVWVFFDTVLKDGVGVWVFGQLRGGKNEENNLFVLANAEKS